MSVDTRSHPDSQEFISTPRLTRVAVVREEYFALTQDLKAAIILNQCVYWMERTQDFDLFLTEEKDRDPHLNISLSYGYFWKSCDAFNDECMLGSSKATISRILSNLVDRGWLDRRNRQGNTFSHLFEYRVNLIKLQADLISAGYVLSGYTFAVPPKQNPLKPAENSISQNETSMFQNETSMFQNETPYIEAETTAKIKDKKDLSQLSLTVQTPKYRTDAEEVKNERELCEKLLSQFSEIVLEGVSLASIPERDRLLRDVFQNDLEESFDTWRQLCGNITKSKFLMGESKGSDFKATLNWVLKDKNALRILESDFGVGDRTPSDAVIISDLQQKILKSGDTALTKQLKQWCLKEFGAPHYRAWFQDMVIDQTSPIHYKVYVKSDIYRDYLVSHYEHSIQAYLRKATGNDSVQLTIETALSASQSESVLTSHFQEQVDFSQSNNLMSGA